ncbi:MAG: peptide chain release factor N(5)-glutamine methyltransferase [Ferruginibacter sp.]
MTAGTAGLTLFSALSKIYNAGEATAITSMVIDFVMEETPVLDKKNKNYALNTRQEIFLEQALVELLKFKPVQQVIGRAFFYKEFFQVNEHVLIPRPETEELVDKIIKEEKGSHQLQILDVGTGSGCIAISLQKNLSSASVTGIDVSVEALEVARNNGIKLKCKVDWKQLNFLDENEWAVLNIYDVIVSNPPYIPEKEKSGMEVNVVMHEPSLALFTPDNDPFIFYKKIADFANGHLSEEGKIYVEVHRDYAQQTAALFARQNFEALIEKDMSGNDRFVTVTRYR